MRVDRSACMIFAAASLALCIVFCQPSLAARAEERETPGATEPTSQQASQDPVAYVDAKGVEAKVTEYKPIDSSATALEAGWYVVEADVTLHEDLVVTGSAHVVLANGAKLIATKRILIKQDAALLVYAQKDKPAMLVLRGGIVREPGEADQGDSSKPTEVTEVIKQAPEQEKYTPNTADEVCNTGERNTSDEALVKVLSGEEYDAWLAALDAQKNDAVGADDVETDAGSAGTDGEPAVQLVQLLSQPVEQSVPSATATTEDEPVQLLLAPTHDAVPAQESSKPNAQPESNDTKLSAASEDTATVTVTFDPNGGSGSMNAIETKANTRFVLPQCGFTPPAGKVFDTWSYGDPGDTVSVPVSTTIRAFWKNDTSQSTSSSTQSSDAPGSQDQTSTQSTNQSANIPVSTSPITMTTTTNNTSSATNVPSTPSNTTSPSTSPSTGDSQSTSLSYALLAAGIAAIAAGIYQKNSETVCR